MKDKVLQLLKEMINDSMSASFIVEKELCSILTLAINQLDKIQEKVGWIVNNYPNKIDSIDSGGWYIDLPKEILCNKGEFCFKTEWLDINLKEYFEELKKSKISCIKKYIAQTEHSLSKYKEDLEHVEELEFEDLEI
jgi:predicted translin family RNA/ssDNA-binding protein